MNNNFLTTVSLLFLFEFYMFESYLDTEKFNVF